MSSSRKGTWPSKQLELTAALGRRNAPPLANPASRRTARAIALALVLVLKEASYEVEASEYGARGRSRRHSKVAQRMSRP